MWKYVLALALSTVLLPVCFAARAASVTAHRFCAGANPTSSQMLLSYWSHGIAHGIPEPVCVFRKPELPNLPILSARVGPSPVGVGAVAIIGLDKSARPFIEQMTRNNIGKLVAFVVDHRIVILARITSVYSDNHILVTTLTRADADAIVSAISPVEHGKRHTAP